MSSQPTEPVVAHVPRKTFPPIDPDSPAGREAAAGLGRLFDDIGDRLRREGKPVPDCFT
jgi:hypothetical protein